MAAYDKRVNLEGVIDGALSRYLPSSGTRFAVAFSGGGDSVALIYALRGHTARAHVLIVDHGLRKGSRAEALAAQKQAQSWGFTCDILSWTPKALTTAIQEKARVARYNLMGKKLRALGINYLLTGHTQGDQAETCLMRYERKTGWRGAAGMRERVYAPIWPALAGVEIIRPLLSCSREQLRAYNKIHGLTWAEDPSNQNIDFTRIRARRYLTDREELAQDLVTTAHELQAGLLQEQEYLELWLKTYATVSDHGFIRLRRRPRKVILGRLIQAVGGVGGVIGTPALSVLCHRMTQADFKAATLGGCQIMANKGEYLLVCEASRAKGRRGLTPAPKPQVYAAGTYLWDQRFMISYTGKDVIKIKHSFGDINRLEDFMRTIPVVARLTLPLIQNAQGDVLGVGAYKREELNVKWLGHERLMGRADV